MSDRLTLAATGLLESWSPPDARQAQLRSSYLHHLARHEQGWSRDCRGAHLTASALIIRTAEPPHPEGPQVLLVLHRKLGRWLQTGGHIEAGDLDLRTAALREAREESGLPHLRLDPEPLVLDRHELTCGGVSGSFHLDVQFLVRCEDDAEPVVSAESEQVRWFAATALPPVDDSVERLVSAARRRLSTA